ncbi:GAF domain-like protein [Mycena rosella]|uniref:GAF domain-like protein n=1 Tax=Mycena rosella TaxID=1033263 RepID=A0AAD7G568_MYCRO|nr:GAF domain-like protein [Mycena rosella]
MPHADSALVPETITTKAKFWAHTYSQLDMLLDSEQRNWVTNLSNASSLIYTSLLAFPPHFGNGQRAVNWCGFYLDSELFPQPRNASRRGGNASRRGGNASPSGRLLLAPFNGKPACQYINTAPGKARGVCADAFLQRRTIVVSDVESYPGHIACDGETRSEIVCPLILRSDEDATVRVLGVLDLDCLVAEGFSDEDKAGLEKIAELLVNACDW